MKPYIFANVVPILWKMATKHVSNIKSTCRHFFKGEKTDRDLKTNDHISYKIYVANSLQAV